MKISKTTQLYIVKIGFPFDSINQIFFKDGTYEKISFNNDYKMKKFIGSDWSIKDSGFMFYGPNNLNVVFNLINLKKSDFLCLNVYKITFLNGIQCKNDIYCVLSIIKNTTDNTTIVELNLEYDSENALEEFEQCIKISSAKKIIKEIFLKMDLIFNERVNKENDFIIMNHSFTIKKNYKDAFNFFYNWNNIAKSIKTDKVWKIISEENDKKYKDFYIMINENIKIHYHVISIDEVKNEKVEIVYNKTSNSFPALNDYIKFGFFNISKELCFFLYETRLPTNISASLYQTVSHYLYYCNKKTKKYIENNL